MFKLKNMPALVMGSSTRNKKTEETIKKWYVCSRLLKLEDRIFFFSAVSVVNMCLASSCD